MLEAYLLDLDVLIMLVDRMGVFVFALSGGIAAVRNDMDLFGVIFLSFLPAIGGGTLRDLILDEPVFWLADTFNLWLATAGGLTAFFLYDRFNSLRPLRWADALGMALFAVTGAATAVAAGYGLFVTAIMGMTTACVGGLMRDVIANREPLLLKEDIYATAALAGAVVFYLVLAIGLDERIAIVLGALGAFGVRALGIVFNLSLPKARKGEG